jgi:ribosome-binding factor A
VSKERVTETSKVVYNLISVAYHALQDAEIYETYVKDAERNNDSAAAELFREALQQNAKIADQAERLPSARLTISRAIPEKIIWWIGYRPYQ